MTSIITPWGKVWLGNDGYWKIGDRGKYHGKRLHLLIWENFYGCEVPEGFHIHHKNGNKQDNCILNLQLIRISEHHRLHNLGRKLSEETKAKISKTLTGRKLPKSQREKLKGNKNALGHTVSQESRGIISKKLSGRKQPKELVEKRAESNKKKYATIQKSGFTENGTRRWALFFKGKILKKSVDKQKLIDFFLKNYPLEILEVYNYGGF